MAHNVSNEYKQVIYSGDARNKLKLLFNNVELQDADKYCEKLTIKSRIVPNGAKIFNLNNFISKEIELVLHDINTNIIQDQVSISIGTLVGNSYEYVPIGIFNIQDTPTNDKNKTIIKLRDNSVKFDFNYNAQPLIEENGESATKLQILQDICTQAGVTCNITSFIGYLDEIGVYDNTITARQYIANIAEQAGKIATINRNGELIFVDLNNLTTWEIPIDIVEKYENGTSFKIGQVVYEDGIVRYETPTSNDDTLFLDGSNNYINGELVKEQASSNDNSYHLINTGESDLAYLELEGKTTQETRTGKNLFNYKDTSNVTSGVTADNEGWITATFDNTSGTANKYMNYWTHNLSLNTSTNYRIITEIKSVSGTGSLIVVSNPNSTSGQIDGSVGYAFSSLSANVVKAETKTTKSSFTNVNDGIRSYVQFAAGQSGSITFRISVLADTSVTPSTFVYEAYGVSPSYDYPSELESVGYKNLFNINSVVMGDYTQAYTTIRASSRQTIYLKAGKYTLKTNMDLSSYGVALVILLDKPPIASYTALQDFGYITSQTQTFNVTREGYAVFVFKKGNNATFTLDEITQFNYMFVKGEQPLDYLPYGKYGIEVKTTDEDNNTNTYLYQLDNPIRSVENIKDLFYIKNNMLYVERKIGSVVLNGTETWTHDTTGQRYWRALDNVVTPADTNTKGQGMSNIALLTANQTIYTSGMDGIAIHPLGRIYISNDVYDTLTTKNVELQYLYANPFVEELGTIEMPQAYNAVTNISINSGIITNSYIEYRKNKTQLEAILNEVNLFDIDSLKTGKILGNPAIDSYDLIQIHDKSRNLLDINTLVMGDYRGDALTIRASTRQEIYLESGEYTLSTNLDLNTYGIAVAILPNKPPSTTYNAIQDFGYVSNQKTTFNVTSDGYVVFTFRKNGNLTFTIDEIKQFAYQFEKGRISTDYVPFKDKTYATLATNDLVYTGVLINTFDTQIGEEAKEQNVTIIGDATFRKWAKTSIDNVEGSLTLQAGKIDEANGKINETNLTIDSQGALLNVIANNSNIDIEYDSQGNPLSGEVREVTTTTGFTFNAEGMTIEDTSSNFKAQHRNTGTYYKEGESIVGQYTKDGSKQKDLELFGVYYYGKENINDDPMFVAQLYTDSNGEVGFGHFYNRGD